MQTQPKAPVLLIFTPTFSDETKIKKCLTEPGLNAYQVSPILEKLIKVFI